MGPCIQTVPGTWWALEPTLSMDQIRTEMSVADRLSLGDCSNRRGPSSLADGRRVGPEHSSGDGAPRRRLSPHCRLARSRRSCVPFETALGETGPTRVGSIIQRHGKYRVCVCANIVDLARHPLGLRLLRDGALNCGPAARDVGPVRWPRASGAEPEHSSVPEYRTGVQGPALIRPTSVLGLLRDGALSCRSFSNQGGSGSLAKRPTERTGAYNGVRAPAIGWTSLSGDGSLAGRLWSTHVGPVCCQGPAGRARAFKLYRSTT